MKKIISYVCIFCFCAFLAPSVSAMTTTIKVIPSDNIAISQQDYGISTSPILSAHPKRRQSKTRLYEPTISTSPILSAHPKRRQSKTRLYEPTISTSPILSAHPKRRQSKTRLYEPTINM